MFSPSSSWRIPDALAGEYVDVVEPGSRRGWLSKWEFPKIRGTLSSGPENKDPTI